MQVSLSVARRLYRAVGTPRALTCEIMRRYGEWGQLADLRVDPHNYLDARALQLDILATEFLRKHDSLETGRDLKQAALASFWESEQLCARTNARISQVLTTPNSVEDLALADFVGRVKSRVRAILGRIPDEVDPRFGPGSTYLDRFPYTTVLDKMSSHPTYTGGAACFLDLWSNTAWGRTFLPDPIRKGQIFCVRGDRFTTVKKDSTKDRGITIPPSINGLYQLGVGRAMRAKLRAYGLDLGTGQETHRAVAREASVTGRFATIDLKSASDTVSRGLCKAVIPSNWLAILEALRCSLTSVRGQWVFLEKFSAMGNGYTFELETLIFASIAHEVMLEGGLTPLPGENLFVYGDDIIVPTEIAGTLLSVLKWFGFQPNEKKTFLTGSFRESCGGDFFDGQPVRGLYLEEEPNEPHKLIALANGLRTIIDRLSRRDVCVHALRSVWHHVLDYIPSDVRRLRGPESLGDLVIHDERGWVTREDRYLQRRFIRCWQPISRVITLDHWKRDVVFAAALYGVRSHGVVPQKRGSDAVSGFRRAWVPLLEN